MCLIQRIVWTNNLRNLVVGIKNCIIIIKLKVSVYVKIKFHLDDCSKKFILLKLDIPKNTVVVSLISDIKINFLQ